MRSLVVLFSLFTLGLAHKAPKTAEEIEVQRRLQSAAYYVRCISFTRVLGPVR